VLKPFTLFRLNIKYRIGVVACGSSIEEAWGHFFDLIYACETQCRALSAAGANLENLIIPSKDVQNQVIEALLSNGVNSESEIKWGLGELEFEAEMRRLDRAVSYHCQSMFSFINI
jgi:hypothetical protein